MSLKEIIIPKKISHIGGTMAIYMDLPTLTYLKVLDKDGCLKPVRIRVEDHEEELEKCIRFNSRGSAYISFTKSECSEYGLRYDDVVAFTIAV